MKLPKRDKIVSEEMNKVYQNDLKELFNPDERSNIKYRYMNRFRTVINFVRNLSESYHKILDIGCAQGNYSLAIGNFSEVVGVDIRLEFIKYALMKKEMERTEFVRSDAENLCFKDSSFDLILALEIIEHIPDPQKLMSEIKRLLKSEGFLILSTPNADSLPYRVMRTYTFKKILTIPQEKRKRFLYTADIHYFLFKEREVESLLNETGFRILKKIRVNSLILGLKTESFQIWLPKILKMIPLETIKCIESAINKAPILGRLFALNLIYLVQIKETKT